MDADMMFMGFKESFNNTRSNLSNKMQNFKPFKNIHDLEDFLILCCKIFLFLAILFIGIGLSISLISWAWAWLPLKIGGSALIFACMGGLLGLIFYGWE